MYDAAPAPARALPHNYEAEQALLGAILFQNRAYERVAETLRPGHFAHPAHAAVYTAIGRILDGGGTVNAVTLKPYLEGDEALAAVGGMEYLVTLVNSVVTVFNVPDYARQIIDLAGRRRLIEIGNELAERAHSVDYDTTAAQIQEAAEQQLFEVQTSAAAATGWVSWENSLDAALQMAQVAHHSAKDGRVVGITTGLTDVDRRLGGLHPTDLVIMAGRPGMGKTGAAISIAVGAARAGYKVGVFSLEMGDGQIALRVLCGHAGLSVEAARRGDTTPDDLQRLAMARQDLSALGMHIDPSAGLSVSAIRTRARRLKQRSGLDLVVVDYIGLAEAPDADRRQQKVHQVGAITKGLKALAKDLHIPVLALSQLSRAVESRDDKRPQLADLRDSGSIEQDADVVLFVYRDEYYLERSEPFQRADEDEGKFQGRYQRWLERKGQAANLAELIVAKNRHGATGTVRLHFDGPSTRFSDLAHGGQE